MAVFSRTGRCVGACLLTVALAACGGGGGTATPVAMGEARAANHAPELAAIADAGNSAESRETRVAVLASDIDGDALALSASVADPAVAAVTVDAASSTVVLEPLGRGHTEVTVTASDGELVASRSFRFTVADVTRSVAVPAATGEAITLVNATDAEAAFVLTHNGFRTYQSTAEIVAEIDAMPRQYPGEPFERRLWRLVRDNTWHDVPLNAATWLSNPAVLVNSLGWGFCHNVAAAYAEIARVAGYESRVWGLNGHVVPEVRIAGQWQLFDPDLAVYYHDAGGGIAGVEALAADPSLITAPLSPLLPAGSWPYDPEVAGIYASTADNAVDPRPFGGDDSLAPPAVLAGRIVLPAGARLTYQGRWTPAPVTDVPDELPTTIEEFEQAAITLAPGWTGTLDLPWVLWDVAGEGTISIGGTPYAAGSAALRTRLRGTTRAPAALEVGASSGALRLVFLVNPLRYAVRPDNQVELTGLEVWRVQVGVEALPEANRPGPGFPAWRRKPAG